MPNFEKISISMLKTAVWISQITITASGTGPSDSPSSNAAADCGWKTKDTIDVIDRVVTGLLVIGAIYLARLAHIQNFCQSERLHKEKLDQSERQHLENLRESEINRLITEIKELEQITQHGRASREAADSSNPSSEGQRSQYHEGSSTRPKPGIATKEVRGRAIEMRQAGLIDVQSPLTRVEELKKRLQELKDIQKNVLDGSSPASRFTPRQ